MLENQWFNLTTLTLCIALGWTAYSFYEHGGMVKGHLQFAETLNNGSDFITHPGIFWFSGILHHATSFSIKQSLFVLTSLHVTLIIPAVLWAFNLMDFTRIGHSWVFLVGALAIMVVSPIGLPWLEPRVYDFVYVRRTVFLLRNATLMALLPYAIITFGFLMKIIQQQITEGKFERKAAIAAAIFLFISSLIKPSFAVSITPAIALYVLFKREISWRAKISIGYIFLPTAFLLLAQIGTGLIYNPLRPVMSLEFAPLQTWSDQNKYPLLAFMLANAFSVFILGYRYNKLSNFTWIAWINLGIAVTIYALLVLNGPGDAARDLEWPYITARQILFLCSAMEWWKWVKEKYTSPSHSFDSFGAPHIAAILLAGHALFGYARLVMVDEVLIRAYGLY